MIPQIWRNWISYLGSQMFGPGNFRHWQRVIPANQHIVAWQQQGRGNNAITAISIGSEASMTKHLLPGFARNR